MFTLYTDGACAPTNPGPCAWGAVLITGPDAYAEHCGFIGHGTNQIAELTAAIQGLLLTPKAAKVVLVSDSQYVVKGLTVWRRGWERNGWVNAKREPVANMTLWQRLCSVADDRLVSAQWVRGHDGDRFNEMADRLAVAGLKLAPTPRSFGPSFGAR